MILSDIVTGREPSTGKDTWPYVGLVMALSTLKATL